ncbi:PilN domain-containing protein [Clostridium sp.]|uniref:PilN domain-containing protein n=1 Tax=Clostridium sp. TaxID=1506 RepID=UPI003F2CEEB6
MKFRDINFFIPYQGRKKETKNRKIEIYVVVGILGIFIFGTLLWNSISIVKLKKDITRYTEELNAPEIQQKAKEADEINNKITLLNEYSKGLTKVTDAIISRDVVSVEILDKLSSTLPTDVNFKSINIVKGNITIQALSKSREAIGEVLHNIKKLDIIEDATISSINSDNAVEGEYSFDINCVLRSVE